MIGFNKWVWLALISGCGWLKVVWLVFKKWLCVHYFEFEKSRHAVNLNFSEGVIINIRSDIILKSNISLMYIYPWSTFQMFTSK